MSGSIPILFTNLILSFWDLSFSFSSSVMSFGIDVLFAGLFVLPFGRSLTCPTLDFTTYSFPKYLEIVLAFAGDSTITRLFVIFFGVHFISEKSHPLNQRVSLPSLSKLTLGQVD